MLGSVTRAVIDFVRSDGLNPMTIQDGGWTVTVSGIDESEKIAVIDGAPIHVYLFSTEAGVRMFDSQYRRLLGYHQISKFLYWTHEHIGVNIATSATRGDNSADCAIVDVSMTILHELCHWASNSHHNGHESPHDWDRVIVSELDYVMDDIDVLDLVYDEKRPETDE